MPQLILYMKCDANVEVNKEDVFLKDVASLQCVDEYILAKCRSIKVWHFAVDTAGSRKQNKRFGKNGGFFGKRKRSSKERVVLSALKLVSLVEQTCPGVLVEILGETDVVLEYITQKKKGIGQLLKIVVVCLVCFFGTAFTIMAYHNDVGIRDVFSEVYEIIARREAQGINPLEVSYSVGLAAGILIFFNHIGNLKLTSDPTPIEVSMKNYEQDVNKTLVEVAQRKGEEKDV